MRATCRRLGDGEAIRDAMREHQMNLAQLAERTKELDPDGNGVSYQLIGFLTATGLSARNTASPRSARLIARALNCPQEKLFEPSSTDMRRIGDGEPLRNAIGNRGTDPARLARRTRRIDQYRRGVAEELIGRLADPDEQEPPVIPQRAAALIAGALKIAENTLFEAVPSVMPASSA